MTLRQSLFVILLGLAIALSAGYYTRKLWFPDRTAAAVNTAPAQPYVSPFTSKLAEARALQAGGKFTQAQEILQKLLVYYPLVYPPSTREMAEVRERLGEINSRLFFSREYSFGKNGYTVQRGDSLWRIARKMESTPETIMRANDLDSALIQPGQRLLVPDGDFRLTVDLPNDQIVLTHAGAFFKRYPIRSADLPRSRVTQFETQVRSSSFQKDGERIPNTEVSEGDTTVVPWIYLARRGYVLYGVAGDADPVAAAASSAAAAAPPMIRTCRRRASRSIGRTPRSCSSCSIAARR